jgi:quercetin dioxygenase-like cupin family protein
LRGDVVFSPSGEEIVLVDVGQRVLHDDPVVRVWEVQLEPGETHPWHLHHNPYVVLSIDGSEGRMDWLDGSEPRFISEHRGGSVYRPVSPVHRLTNIGTSCYRNRLVELKDLGEHQSSPLDVHPDDVNVCTVADCTLDLDGPHVLAALDIEDVRLHPGGPCALDGEWFVVELRYLG